MVEYAILALTTGELSLDTRFRNPALYPLSYEGLTCEFTG